jgi:hypothetical protein
LSVAAEVFCAAVVTEPTFFVISLVAADGFHCPGNAPRDIIHCVMISLILPN